MGVSSEKKEPVRASSSSPSALRPQISALGRSQSTTNMRFTGEVYEPRFGGEGGGAESKIE